MTAIERTFNAPARAVPTLQDLLARPGVEHFIFQYLQLVLGLSPLAAGLWTVPAFGTFIVGATLTPLIARPVRPGL